MQVEDVLDYWFGEQVDGFPVEDRAALWWAGGPETDAEIRDRFGEAALQARAGALKEWERDPRGSLALTILLDQLPRNIYRGQPEAFASDAAALEVAREGLERGFDRALSWSERVFYYTPFEHSERGADQMRSVELFAQMLAEAPVEARPRLETSAAFAKEHLEIIERFGRFPHRNEVLARDSTPEEVAYLASGGSRFGQ